MSLKSLKASLLARFSLPERDHVAQFGGQAAELIGRQVEEDQVGQLGDVWRDAAQVVVVDVQRRQVGERP